MSRQNQILTYNWHSRDILQDAGIWHHKMLSIGRPPDVGNWLGWMRSDSDQNMTFDSDVPGPVCGHQTSVLTSPGRPGDVSNVLWMSNSDQRWIFPILIKIWLSDIPKTSRGRHKCLGKVRFWLNLDIVGWRPLDVLVTSVSGILGQTSDVILTKTWRPQNIPGTSDC